MIHMTSNFVTLCGAILVHKTSKMCHVGKNCSTWKVLLYRQCQWQIWCLLATSLSLWVSVTFEFGHKDWLLKLDTLQIFDQRVSEWVSEWLDVLHSVFLLLNFTFYCFSGDKSILLLIGIVFWCFEHLNKKHTKSLSLPSASLITFVDICSISSVPNCFFNNFSSVFNEICLFPVSNIALTLWSSSSAQ